MPLRAVIFGLEGVFFEKDGTTLSGTRRQELQALFAFLQEQGINPIILSNRSWSYSEEGEKHSVDDYLTEEYGEHVIYETTKQCLPPKGTKEIVARICSDCGLEVREVAYVGTTEWDMRTAINSKLLFLNAIWLRQDVPYGFTFARPAEITAFIEVFGQKEHPWFFVIDDPVTLRSMGAFSTRRSDYERYSRAAREAAKQATDERVFFLQSLVASVYLSGLSFNYIACVPGHETGYGNSAMDDVLRVVGQTFNARYVPDLIVRHADAPKSQAVRIAGNSPSPLSQVNTIHLTKRPIKDADGARYKTPIGIKGKTVLVIDDFCTEGNSLEAARLYLEAAGANVLLVPWLKTINTPYYVLEITPEFDPYEPQNFTKAECLRVRELSYHGHIVDNIAPKELLSSFKRYKRSRQ